MKADSRVGLIDVVSERAGHAPDGVAWRELDGGRHEMTWREHVAASSSLAGGLAQLGVVEGDFVLTMLPNAGDSFLTWTALSCLGAVEVTVNDAYIGSSLRHVIDLTDARIAIVHERYFEQWRAVIAASRLEVVVLVGGERDECSTQGIRLIPVADVSASAPLEYPRGGAASEPGIVIFTSGTTGPSKGVIMPWGQMWHRACGGNLVPPDYFDETDVLYNVLPIFHVAGREQFYRVASGQGSLRCREKFSASQWLSDIRTQECTFTCLIGAMTQFVLEVPEQPDDADNPLRGVCYAPIGPEVDRFKKRFGLEVFASYGMTECSHPVGSWPYTVSSANYSSCGVELPNRKVRIVDDSGADVVNGDVGELLVKDDRDEYRMAIGYLGNPEATSAAWADGWFHTGDAFRRDEDGYFYFVDRIKDAIRRRGENISSFEIERVASAFPGVAAAAAFAVPSQYTEDEVMLAVTAEKGVEIDYRALHTHLGENLPRFAVPSYIEVLEEFPVTPTAKVQKAALRSRGVTEATWTVSAQKSSPRS